MIHQIKITWGLAANSGNAFTSKTMDRQETQTKQNPFQNAQVRGLDWASGDSSECDSFKSKTSHSASLFNITILKTNTKIKNSIKYTYKKVQYNIRVTCFFFKHYPGLFIPLDKGTPSVFQLPSRF